MVARGASPTISGWFFFLFLLWVRCHQLEHWQAMYPVPLITEDYAGTEWATVTIVCFLAELSIMLGCISFYLYCINKNNDFADSRDTRKYV